MDAERGGATGRPPRRARVRVGLGAGLFVVAVLAGCGLGDVPEVPAGPDGVVDPALVQGREIYAARCASCHGSAGGGGSGTALSDGRVVASFPNVADQIELVANGRRAMPGFGGSLSAEEIEAVVRYTREVL